MSMLLNPHRFAAAVPPGFSPAILPGLAQWYDPSDNSRLTMNSSTVAQMDDKSGNGDHATQVAAGAQPSLGSINGVQALSFSSSGTDDEMVLPDPAGIAGSQNRTLFVVFQVAVTSNNQGIIAYGTNGFGEAFEISTNSNDDLQLSVWGEAYNHTVVPGTAPHMACAVLDGTRLSDCLFSLDGAAEEASGSQTIDTAAVGGSRIGRLYDSSTFALDGLIGEAILYDHALPEADRQKVEGYLAHKWGLAANLPVDHPYKSEAP